MPRRSCERHRTTEKGRRPSSGRRRRRLRPDRVRHRGDPWGSGPDEVRSSLARENIVGTHSSRPEGRHGGGQGVRRRDAQARSRRRAARPTARWAGSSMRTATRRTTRPQRPRIRRRVSPWPTAPEHLGHRTAFDRSERELHGRAARGLRDRRRSRPPLDGRGVRDPRSRRRRSARRQRSPDRRGGRHTDGIRHVEPGIAGLRRLGSVLVRTRIRVHGDVLGAGRLRPFVNRVRER